MGKISKTGTIWARVKKFFPEQQIYFRANGRVRFLSISTGVQMAVSALLLVALGWGAVTSIYFLGRDEAIASRDETIEVLTSAYHNASQNIAALEGDLNQRAEAIEERQKIIEGLIEGSPDMALAETAAGIDPERPDATGLRQEPAANPGPEAPGDDLAFNGSSGLFASSAFASPTPVFENRAEALSMRLSLIEAHQKRLAISFSNLAEQRLDEVSAVLGSAGLKIEEQLALWDQSSPDEGASPVPGTGGPFIPLAENEDKSLIYSVGEHEVGAAFARLQDDWARVRRAIFSLDRVPHFVPPEDYYLSSRYGTRTDPIKNIPAFHPGIDMSGWPGTKIRASATGTVVYAGWYGAYGNMVEIDHGNGFKTRYGHLRKILVKKGDVVTLAQQIGEMGKTGRVTDTHVHFEIWLNGELHDPLPFMKVSDDVFEIQRRYTGYAELDHEK